MSDADPTLEATDHPLRPKIDVDVDQIAQPRSVEWGHLSQLRGELQDDRVRVERQRRRHHFDRGMSDSGAALPLFEGPLGHAVAVYRALDALLDGGYREADDDADAAEQEGVDGEETWLAVAADRAQEFVDLKEDCRELVDQWEDGMAPDQACARELQAVLDDYES